MNMSANESSPSSSSNSDGSDTDSSEYTCNGSCDDIAEMNNGVGVQPYQFEPGREVNTDDDDLVSYEENEILENRLGNLNWCTCGHCQIMDRYEESVCCHEINEIDQKNCEVAEIEGLAEKPDCITDNPGFAVVCLNHWVLQVSWYSYKQQYGSMAHEGPEHKKNRHVAYRQLARWCWGTLGKEIRVALPSCAVSCIRAHFCPPGLEENFEFKGFHYADE